MARAVPNPRCDSDQNNPALVPGFLLNARGMESWEQSWQYSAFIFSRCLIFRLQQPADLCTYIGLGRV